MATLLAERSIILLIAIIISSYHSVKSFCNINAWNESNYRLASIIAATHLASALNNTLSNCNFGLRHEFEPSMSTCLKHCSLRSDCVAAYITGDAGCRFCITNSGGNQHTDLDRLNYGEILVNFTAVMGKSVIYVTLTVY